MADGAPERERAALALIGVGQVGLAAARGAPFPAQVAALRAVAGDDPGVAAALD